MDAKTFEPNPTIFTKWTSNKTCLVVEDATHLDTPKIRFAIVPANDNPQPVCDFYLDIPDAHTLFHNLRNGVLEDIASRSNKNRDATKGFDRYATMPNGNRSLTIKNKMQQSGDKEIGILIVKNNGEKHWQKVYLTPFQAQSLALTCLTYLHKI